jgi:protein N-terminal methyltransferase
MRNFYVDGLQKFDFSERYDCIWVQWVFSQLNDEDAVAFLKKAKASLNEGGVIILKENHCSAGFVVDKEDYSVTRSSALFKELFLKAGLKIVKE